LFREALVFLSCDVFKKKISYVNKKNYHTIWFFVEIEFLNNVAGHDIGFTHIQPQKIMWTSLSVGLSICGFAYPQM
jgi:hypothetical protein